MFRPFGRIRVALGLIAAAIALVVLAAGSASAAHAAGKKPSAKVTRLSIAPKAPKATDGIVVRFRAGALRAGERYLVSVGAVNLIPLVSAVDCTEGLALVVKGRKRRGQTIEVRLYPNGAAGGGDDTRLYGAQPGGSGKRFCAREQDVIIGKLDPDGDARMLVRRKLTIARDAAYPEPLGTPARLNLLDGSSVTVQAPGRPDRTLPLAGTLRGTIAGVFMPNTDIQIGNLAGALTLSSVTPDPLCAGPAYTTQLGMAPGPTSSMTLLTSGRAAMSLDVLADPRSIAGCATPANPGKSNVLVSGTVGPEGLPRLRLSGTIGGVQIAPDVTATLTFNLLVQVDLSGRA